MTLAVDSRDDVPEDGDFPLASFNVDQRRENNTWESTTPVNIERVRKRLSAYDSLVRDNGDIVLPLHETDKPVLTGEYILYTESDSFPKYVFYDSSSDESVRLSPTAAAKTCIADQLRFWNTDYRENLFAMMSGCSIPEQQTVFDPVDRETSDIIDYCKSVVSQQKEADRKSVLKDYKTLSADEFHSLHDGLKNVEADAYTEQSDNGDLLRLRVSDSYAGRIPQLTQLYPDNEVVVGISRAKRAKSETVGEFVTGVVDTVTRDTLTIRISATAEKSVLEDIQSEVSKGNRNLRVAPLFNPVPYDREMDAIKTFADEKADLVSLFQGDRPVEFSPARSVSASFSGLNDSQEKAAKMSLAADDIALIHGPPGTGKTHTLTQIITELVENDNSVLVCAHSNQATDNLIAGTSSVAIPDTDSLHHYAMQNNIELSRVGENVTNEVVERDYADVSPNNADIVAGTMSSLHKFSVNEFDVAVVDEAGQASIPATLLPINAAKKSVLAGDHKQLPPHSTAEQEDGVVSLFEHLVTVFGDSLPLLLNRQYRMNAEIASLSNRLFYNGKITTDESVAASEIEGIDPIELYNVKTREKQALETSYKNSGEVKQVVKQVDTLVSNGVDESDIGIITPYIGQKKQIESSLAESSQIKVDTVDSFQGGERDAIIVSFVRSNADGETGFLTDPDDGPKRLNVALTRAKRHLSLIGNWKTLLTHTEEPSCTEKYRELYQMVTGKETPPSNT